MKRNLSYDLDFNLPMDEFVVRCHELIPAEYGKMICKKIFLDSKYMLSKVNDSDEVGDLTICKKEFYEIKTSYLNKSGRFGIKNIRSWQNFDYFILCLIDTRGTKYKPYFYCIEKDVIINSPILILTGQNNTKDSNGKNREVGQSTTFDVEDHKWLFKKKSVLKGTDYEDLLDYIENRFKLYNTKSDLPALRVNNRVNRNPVQKVCLDMGKYLIDGPSNKDVMVNLVRDIGPDKLYGVIWKCSLNKIKNGDRNVEVGQGYYLNPKFSIRDLNLMISHINSKLNLSIKVIKK